MATRDQENKGCNADTNQDQAHVLSQGDERLSPLVITLFRPGLRKSTADHIANS